jgi:hypothetical protein
MLTIAVRYTIIKNFFLLPKITAQNTYPNPVISSSNPRISWHPASTQWRAVDVWQCRYYADEGQSGQIFTGAPAGSFGSGTLLRYLYLLRPLTAIPRPFHLHIAEEQPSKMSDFVPPSGPPPPKVPEG